MAKKDRQKVTLAHPDGKRTYTTGDPAEITRLKAHGYTEKPASKPANSSTTTRQGSDGS